MNEHRSIFELHHQLFGTAASGRQRRLRPRAGARRRSRRRVDPHIGLLHAARKSLIEQKPIAGDPVVDRLDYVAPMNQEARLPASRPKNCSASSPCRPRAVDPRALLRIGRLLSHLLLNVTTMAM